MKRQCPTCRGTAVKDGNKLYPFCSERCYMADLGRWLGEEYRIAGRPDPEAVAAIENLPDPSGEPKE
ncbi:MAG: DNA gyrase inhibitor YacG [Deltaproteobacteria bacterium]|nr:DNA gyrase inhibitor YacG [Deltaproteobacteria bacterium]MDQ3296033.1 DNA gyrase inhibitor YacG [Myxococcota bacterium]